MSELEWLDIFSENLVSILQDTDITQRGLSEMSGLSEASISNYIHKKRMPNIKAVVNLAYALNCSMDDLIDFGDTIE